MAKNETKTAGKTKGAAKRPQPKLPAPEPELTVEDLKAALDRIALLAETVRDALDRLQADRKTGRVGFAPPEAAKKEAKRLAILRPKILEC